MIARPLRRPGPIPFSSLARALPPPSLPLADLHLRSRWMPADHAEAEPLPPLQSRPASPAAPAAPATQAAPAAPAATGAPQAVYHGQGVLSVRSPVTGHLYRFSGQGHTQPIDPRDRLFLSRLADLQVAMPLMAPARRRWRDD